MTLAVLWGYIILCSDAGSIGGKNCPSMSSTYIMSAQHQKTKDKPCSHAEAGGLSW